MARQLRIAVAIDLEWPLRRHHEVYAGIEAYAETKKNWVLVLNNYPEVTLDGIDESYDGIVGRVRPSILKAARATHVPVVNVWLNSSVADSIPTVVPDQIEAGRMAAKHLYSRGLRRFAFVGFQRDRSSRMMLQGLKEVAAEHVIPYSLRFASLALEHSRTNWQRFCRSITTWLKDVEGPLGVCVASDILARQFTTVSRRLGWAIPDEMALVSCGNEITICEAARPRLSSVALQYFKQGYEAARQLDALLRGRKPKQMMTLFPPAEVVTRRSTDVFAVDDKAVARALRFMSENCGKPVSVERIAESAQLGRRTLERRFSQMLGRSVNQELLRLRMERLKRLLVETDRPIKSLLAQVAFGATHLFSMFKRHEGVTPKEYREKHTRNPVRVHEN